MLVVLVCLLLVELSAGRSAGGRRPDSRRCLAEDGKFYSLLSTMTPYDDVRDNIPDFKDCEAENVWGFFRHATRFPHDNQIASYANLTILRDQILENHNQSRGRLCKADLEVLRKWHFVADMNQNMLLTSSGVEELRKTGERLRKVFPKLLKDYSSGQVDIKITSKERTRQSAEAFVTGLYKTHFRIDNSFINDTLLKNEQKCPAWKLSTKNPKLKAEKEKFLKSRELQQLLSRVSERLGFPDTLPFDTVKEIYDVCGFEYAWYHNGQVAPWCTVFTDEDLKILEYFEDFSYYYKSAYGNEYTAKLGCALVRDMVQRFSSESRGAALYFGHSSGNRKLLTALGIGRDEAAPTGDGYSAAGDRAWRTSYLTPFAANLVAVKYRCKKNSHGIKEKERVAVFVNERLVRLPTCGGRSMCPLEEFRKVYAGLTNPSYCNRDFCKAAPSTRAFQPDSDSDLDLDEFDDDD